MQKHTMAGILFFSSLLIFSGCGKDDPEKIAEKDREKILEYIAEEGLDAQEHESGIFYVIEIEGAGGHPTANSRVKINYTGKLLDGDVFDSNYGASMNLYSTIQGWQIGIPLFKKGGKGILIIPSGLGYGQYPQMGIPANSILVFDIELVDYY
ncbi:MAG: FKBP-type peptidyl-prolyl cis-trans isomerase [Bacteroidales bacterium]